MCKLKKGFVFGLQILMCKLKKGFVIGLQILMCICECEKKRIRFFLYFFVKMFVCGNSFEIWFIGSLELWWQSWCCWGSYHCCWQYFKTQSPKSAFIRMFLIICFLVNAIKLQNQKGRTLMLPRLHIFKPFFLLPFPAQLSVF